MRLVITPEESARLDAAASDPVDVLMERAGVAVALAAVRLGAGYGSRVAVLAGTGNNGGDGYVAARHLARRGCAVTVHAAGPPKGDSGPARAASIGAVREGVRVVPAASTRPEPADVIVDAAFGVGFHGDLPAWVRAWSAETVGTPVVAVDLPSGLDASTGEAAPGTMAASTTVTFHALKPGHLLGIGPDLCGRTEIADIGLRGGEAELRVADASDAPRPLRARSTHKWAAGSVLVAGGSPGITGAPMLAARAALAFGAGAVTLASPARLQPLYAGMGPGIMTRGVGSGDRFTAADVPDLLEASGRYDVVVLGPGLGPGVEEFVAGVLDGWPGRLVLDADGLNALGGPDLLVGRSAPTLLTPHLGEFRRIVGDTGDDPSYRVAAELATTTGAIVLLKGNPTFVLGAERWAVDSGGPELATIGTGDVLAGMVAALWAGGLDGERAARSGAYWHGVSAAGLAATGTVTAEHLAEAIRRHARPTRSDS